MSFRSKVQLSHPWTRGWCVFCDGATPEEWLGSDVLENRTVTGFAPDVYVVQGEHPAETRSAYLEQVPRIAPPRLRDRGAEVAELARFCLDVRASGPASATGIGAASAAAGSSSGSVCVGLGYPGGVSRWSVAAITARDRRAVAGTTYGE